MNCARTTKSFALVVCKPVTISEMVCRDLGAQGGAGRRCRKITAKSILNQPLGRLRFILDNC